MVAGANLPMGLLLPTLLAELLEVILLDLEDPEAIDGVLDIDLSLLVNMLLWLLPGVQSSSSSSLTASLLSSYRNSVL